MTDPFIRDVGLELDATGSVEATPFLKGNPNSKLAVPLNRVSQFVEVLIGGRHALECGDLAPLWISNWPNRKRKRCQATALQNGYVCPDGRQRPRRYRSLFAQRRFSTKHETRFGSGTATLLAEHPRPQWIELRARDSKQNRSAAVRLVARRRVVSVRDGTWQGVVPPLC